jgi:hypothetical protein
MTYKKAGRLGERAGALPGIMHHPDALPQRDARRWPARPAGYLLGFHPVAPHAPECLGAFAVCGRDEKNFKVPVMKAVEQLLGKSN